jgi:hypothetical protein
MEIDTPKIKNLTTDGFVKTYNSDGSLQIDSSTYLTSVAFSDLTDYPADSAGALTNDGSGNLSWSPAGGLPSDPDIDAILGWDDTDGNAVWFAIGSGLSYDHSSHTLSSTGGASAFTSLTDCPASYTGYASQMVFVKSDETGLEFVSPSSYGLSSFNNDSGFITGVAWNEIGGTQSDISVSGFNNDAGYITQGSWDSMGGTQSNVNVSGFNNDAGFITQGSWDSMGGTQSNVNISGFYNDSGYVDAGYVTNLYVSTFYNDAGYVDSSYVTGLYVSTFYNDSGYITQGSWDSMGGTQSNVNISGFNNDAGYLTTDSFVSWRSGTDYTPTGVCKFTDGANAYVNYYNLYNSGGSMVLMTDGSNTVELLKSTEAFYNAGTNDVFATMNGTYVVYAEAVDLSPAFFSNTKASTNSSLAGLIIERNSSSTPAGGIGVKLQMNVQNADGVSSERAHISTELTDVTDGAEDADIVIKQDINGSLTETLRIDASAGGNVVPVKDIDFSASVDNSIILKDTVTSTLYRIKVVSGVVTAVAV